MPVDVDKLRALVSAVEAEKLSKEAAEQERRRLKHIEYLKKWQRETDELLDRIPQMVEEAAKKGLREALILEFPTSFAKYEYYQIATRILFGKGYSPRYFDDSIRKVYDYCKSHKLNPIIGYISGDEESASCYRLLVNW